MVHKSTLYETVIRGLRSMLVSASPFHVGDAKIPDKDRVVIMIVTKCHRKEDDPHDGFFCFELNHNPFKK
jgi:hypothetical protein